MGMLDVEPSPSHGSNTNMTSSYDALVTELREIGLLSSIGSLLEWDERTQLPAKGAEHRGNQSALLAGLTHRRFTSAKVDELLQAIEGSDLVRDPESDPTVNVRETRRAFDRAKKLPESLVEELTRTAVLGQHAWAEARKKSDFAAFSPWLEKILNLKKQQADCIGFTAHPYDALLDEFEPGDTTADLTRVFDELRGPLVDLIRRIAESSRKIPADILERRYPAAAQEKLARDAATAIGFDFQAGRLDTSVHPFCTGIGPGDTRMTTRYDENYFGDAFFGVLHETGHGLYEQGLPPEHFGTPRGEFISLGIHESQSRLWENLVGRSRSFWTFFGPKARAAFPEALAGVSDEDWYRAINEVRPSFIRTESDEATYNLHILLRFELEQAMITGDLAAADLPAAWNEKMKTYLGITPPDDAHGVLQDIHWSGGAIGYFPTYTLGNLYAAQFFEQAKKDLGDIDASFARGDFAPLLAWLREKIHRHGKRYTARQLVKKVTGTDLSAGPLLKHLNQKAAEIYGV
jgi:carboxypeptidase Taq